MNLGNELERQWHAPVSVLSENKSSKEERVVEKQRTIVEKKGRTQKKGIEWKK